MGYAGGGFPVLVLLRGYLRPRPIQRGRNQPSVSLIIAARNEARLISEKLNNTLALEYPPSKVEVVIASDGSNDGTNEIVQRYRASNVRLLDLPDRGKNAAINAAVAEARGEIFVLTDADTLLSAETLEHLLPPFSDPEIGAVAGEKRPAGLELSSGVQRLAWRFQRGFRQSLSRAGSLTLAEGQIYAVRRELFPWIPDGVSDDLFVSSRVVAAKRRLVYEPRAYSCPCPGRTDVQKPLARRIRISRRSLGAIWLARDLFDAREHGFFALQLFSHKLLRRLLFFPLISLAATTPFLYRSGSVYRVAAVGQVAFHSAAALGYLLRGNRLGRTSAIRFAYLFDMRQVANAFALLDLGLEENGRRWEPQRR